MTINDILEHATPGKKLQVLNSPFVYDGKVTITLEGGDKLFWIFAEDDRMLSVNPSTEEVVSFMPLEETVEGDTEAVMHHGDEYEFSYEDKGRVELAEDGADYDENAEITFKDFESEDGEIIRLATSTHLEDPINFIGQATLEDDILAT
jgi:PAS domain-containing protein